MEIIINFIKDNYVYFIIGGAVLLGIIILLLIFSSVKKKKFNDNFINDDVKADESVEIDKIHSIKPPLSKNTTENGAQEVNSKTANNSQEVNSKSDKDPQDNSVGVNTSAARPQLKGKWQIKKKSDTDYYVYLLASNGEIMLSSEAYTTEEGALSGIDTIKKNALSKNFTVYCDKNGKYYFKLKTSNNRLLCVGEVYSTKSNCINGIESLVRFCDTAVIADGVLEELTEMFYVPGGEVVPVKEGYSGKWVIKPVNDMFMAMLYASNGELLVAGESYTTPEAAKKSIDNIIKNALMYNFIIDRNKNDKYYFKLRNINRNVICVGEAYDSKAACSSAIDSVIRFCNAAKREY